MSSLFLPLNKHLPINDLTLNIIDFGLQEKDCNHKQGPLLKPEYVLQYMIDGKGSYSISGKTYTVKKGDLFMLPKNVMLSYNADISDPYTYYWIGIDGVSAKKLLELADLTYKHPVISYSNNKIIEIFDKIKNSLVANTFTEYLNAQSCLYELFSLLLSYKAENSLPLQNASVQYVSEAIAFIKDNYNNDILVTDIAKKVGLCRNYFSVIFTKSIGMPPVEYLMRYRISQAQTMLKQKMSVTDVALYCGFNSISNFSVQFKNIVGISPYNYKIHYGG